MLKSRNSFVVGDRIALPFSKEFGEDVFIVTSVRSWYGAFMLDVFCDGDETICMSVNSSDAVKVGLS